MDVYVVVADGKVIGVSARLQGAESIRADFERMNGGAETSIENHELRDFDE